MSTDNSKSEITLLVDGRKFYCLKEFLSQNSTYFQSMFFSNFAEKDKKEVVIKGVSSEDFELFFNAIQGVNSISDKNVENALSLASFLASSKLEEMCMTHLARRSRIPLKEQFQLAEMHNSERLMIQVCSSIEDAYELDEVVPKNLDSFCNTTKNIVLRRSFELLGIRKPSLPPQSEEPSHVFEKMMNEFLDQADIQNHHGMILADHAALLENHIRFEEYLDRVAPEAKILIQQDPRMHELMEQLQNTHAAAERNAVRAQILVVKLKNIYTKQCEKGVSHNLEGTPVFLEKLYRIMLRNQRDHSKSVPSVRGEKLIDHMYRRIMETVDDRSNYETASLYDGTEQTWVSKIKQTIEVLLPCRDEITADNSYRISSVTRGVSDGTRFQVLTQFVQIARESYFMGRMRSEEDNWNQNQAEQNMQ